MVKSTPEASIASITSPEHGAQHECSRTFFCPPGGFRIGRTKSFITWLACRSLYVMRASRSVKRGRFGYLDGTSHRRRMALAAEPELQQSNNSLKGLRFSPSSGDSGGRLKDSLTFPIRNH